MDGFLMEERRQPTEVGPEVTERVWGSCNGVFRCSEVLLMVHRSTERVGETVVLAIEHRPRQQAK
jgi:hypothetical protein